MEAFSNLSGELCIITSCFAYALFNILSKITIQSRETHPMQSMAMITVPQALLLIYFMSGPNLKSTISESMKKPRSLTVITILTVLEFFFHMSALEFLPASDITAIYSLRSLVVAPFAYLLLNETLSKLYPIMLCISFFGIILVVQPEFFFHTTGGNTSSMGYFCAFLNMILQSATILLARIDKPDSFFLVLCVRVVDAGLSSTFCLLTGTWTSFTIGEYILIFAISMCAMVGLLSRMTGYNKTKSGIVTLLMTSQIWITCAMELVILGQVANMMKYVGFFCSFVATAYYAYSLSQGNEQQHYVSCSATNSETGSLVNEEGRDSANNEYHN